MFLKKHLNLIIVGLLALIFFIGTASFNYLTQSPDYVKWSSPDETANYFFAKHFSQTGQLAVFDQASLKGDNMVMPRSVRSDNGWLKPVSFLGISLIYGGLGALFGVAVIPYLTPFFAALGLIFFYLVIRRLFSGRVGLISAFLLAAFPVYIYYTVRSMFHNVLFIVLLLLGLYLFIISLGRPRAVGSLDKTGKRFLTWRLPIRQWGEILAAYGSGIFIGLAVITRTSELLWLLPAGLVIWIFYLKRWGATKPLVWLAGFLLALLPAAYFNQILYGSFWFGGYNAMNQSLADIASTSGALWQFTWRGEFLHYRHYLGQIFRQIFYFGFNYPQSVAMLRHYILEMFPALAAAGLLGLLILIGQNIRRFHKKHLVYFLTWLLSSAILIFYYGSWKFNDNPDLTHFTIGNSYTRYWLPIYLGLIPLAALALVRFSRALLLLSLRAGARWRAWLATGLQAAVILLYISSSLIFVLYGSEEGLAFLYYNDRVEHANTEKVWALTEPSSVIITQYYDKFFWPERRVIVGTVGSGEILTAAGRLLSRYPVYYYNFYLDPAAVNYLNNGKLRSYGLGLSLVGRLNSHFGLYRLYANPAATSSPASSHP